MEKRSLAADARGLSRQANVIAARAANAIRRYVEPGAVMPCTTSLGESGGNAFAARTSLPGPTTGPYQAALASTAKRNASRQRPRANEARRKEREAADNPDITAVYHAAAIGLRDSSSGADGQLDFDLRRQQQRVVNRTMAHCAHQGFRLIGG